MDILPRRFGQPLETALALLDGKWKPAILTNLKERLLRSAPFRVPSARFRADVRPETPSPAGQGEPAPVIPSRIGQTSEEAECYGPRPSFHGRHSMQLYLVRHGIAVENGEGIPDGLRALSDKGRRRFQKTARAFGKLGHKLDLILTSPLVRAVQTAEILAGATRHREVAAIEQLDPKFDVAALRAAVEARAGGSTAVALVGHEPQLSSFLAALSGVSPADIDLKKGAIARIDVSALKDPDTVAVRWWLKPKTGTQVKGLPLQKGAARKQPRAARAETPRVHARTSKKANRRKRAVGSSSAPTPPGETAEAATL